MPRVLKAAEVHVDNEKTVRIKSLNPLRIEEEQPEEESALAERPEDIIQRARDEADVILRNAEIKSRSLVSNAQENAAVLIAEAKAHMEAEAFKLLNEKRQEGYQQGLVDSTAEGDAIKDEAQKVLENAIAERDAARLDLEPDAVKLIISIVEKLIQGAVEINPALVVSLIRMGFADINSLSGQVTVRVSENDYEEATAHKEEIAAAAGGTAEIEIVRDLSLAVAECIIDTPFGGIDVSLAPQFEALKENLLFLLKD